LQLPFGSLSEYIDPAFQNNLKLIIMKAASIHLSCFLLLGFLFIPFCKKSDVTPAPRVIPGVPGSIDTVSNHFRFLKSIKHQGVIPGGPANPSLKISFEDTLYLLDAVPKPIKFLHTKQDNVAGVYLQASAVGINGKLVSTHYYEVPESKGSEESDTVSIIMVGIDPQGLQVPFNFDLTITPFDKDKKPLAEATRPVKIEEGKNTPAGNGDGCGLVLPPGERWEWDLSIITDVNGDGELDFENYPGKVFGAAGQDIEGSCCNGHSKWPEFCVGEKKHNKKLHFGTYYRINFETFRFYSNGTFFRQTVEDAPVPVPAESDFCGSGAGMLKESLKHSTYEGDWTIKPAVLPPDLQHLKDSDTEELSLRATGGTGIGYGNPGGIIHQLDCEFLTMIQVDREGRRHLIKYYTRKGQNEPIWFPFE
jgi:hypothetical protein